MNTEQELADFEAWWESTPILKESKRTIAEKAYQAGRANLKLQDRENAEWLSCGSRRPWVVNSLKGRAKELRDAEKRSRRAFRGDYMGEPARYFADACSKAAEVFEAKLGAIDHARTIEGEGK